MSHTNRLITHRTRGHGHGPLVRLMSPSDLGQLVKPFVFLDLFDADRETARGIRNMPIHPHSGIATVTLPIEGSLNYDDPVSNTSGTLRYGGLEWACAAGGMWHGKEMTIPEAPRLLGFQLWVALPAELENGEAESRYIEAQHTPQIGPARLIIGSYEEAHSPVPAPKGLNYLLITLKAGESWRYTPPAGHTVGWLALAKGALSTQANEIASAGEMLIFEPSNAALTLTASWQADAVFVLGSAISHPYPLHLGDYSVHTSATALEAGEQRIMALGRKLQEAGDRRRESGSIPIFR